MKTSTPSYFILAIFLSWTCSLPVCAQTNCNTFLGSIDDPGNDCAPCTNGMQKLLRPYLMHKNRSEEMNALQRVLDEYLENEQKVIDNLMEKQKATDRVLKEWGIDDLNKIPTISETDYLQNTIDDMRAYIKRFPEQSEWFQEWIARFEQMIRLLKEQEAIADRADQLAEKIRNGDFLNLEDLEFDCCPSAVEDGNFSPDQLNGMDQMLEELQAQYDAYYDYRSKLVDEVAALTKLLEAMLSQRAKEEKEAYERRDAYANGLSGFLVSKIQEGIETGMIQALEAMGYKLSSAEKGAIEAFSTALSNSSGALATGGGMGGVSGEAVQMMIDAALADMSENDRQALGMVSNAVFSEITGRVVQQIFAQAFKSSLANFLSKGLGDAALPLALLDKLITIAPYLWEDKNRMILQGAFDRILLGLVQSIRLCYGTGRFAPQSPLRAFENEFQGKAIKICLPEQNFDPLTADKMKQALYRSAFGYQYVPSLSENERAEIKKDGARSHLVYTINNRVRFEVRFPCYCGKLEEKTTFTPGNIPPPWNNITLTNENMKPGFAAILTKDKTFPWIPVGGGVIGAGVITYIILQDDGGGGPSTPTTDPPNAVNDIVSVPCGQTTATVNAIANDTGDAISITTVTPSANVEVTIVGGGSLQISNIPKNNFSFSYTIVDSEGRTASATVQVNVSDEEAPTITCPPDQSLTCGSDTGTGVAGMATATDLCSPNEMTITFSDDGSGLTECSNTGVLVRMFTAFDPAGNGSQCSQIITILPDEIPPTINCPANTNVECGESTEPTITGNASGSDNCGLSVTINFTDDNSGLAGCNSTGTLTRIWTAEDDCDNQQTCEQTITIVDTSLPSITCPENISIECQESTDPAMTGTATGNDNCTTAISPSYEDNTSGLTGCNNTGNLLRVWTAADDCGNTQSCTQTITVTDSTPPEILCPPATTVICTSPIDPAITGVPSVSDNCSTTGLQTTFEDDDSGVVNCEGIIIRTWTATDDCGNSQSCDQTITVMEQGPPIVTCPDNMTVQCGENTDPSVLGNASAEFFCGDPTAGTIDFSDDDNGLDGCNNTGSIVRTWTVLDDCGNGVTCQQIITVEDTTAPTITCPQDMTIQCDQSADPSETGAATADDNCTTSISPTFEDDASGQMGCNNTGELLRTWLAIDDCGNESTCVQSIQVEDTTPPSILCPPSTTVSCTGSTDPTVTGSPNVSDNCTAASNLQPIFSDDDSGVNNCMGNIIRTWMVTDDCGNTQSCEQTLTVQAEDAPTLTCPSNITIQCDDSIDPVETGNASVTYHCGSQAAGTLTYDDDTNGQNGCNNTGSLIRTWTATDSCGNESSCEQTITVEDTTTPTVTCPDNLTVQCDGSTDPAETGSATGSDNCSAAVEITFADDASGQNGCSGTGSLVRTWTAADSCGNVSTCEQTITVEDTTVPTVTCPDNLTVQCDGSIDPTETGSATGSDNCSAAVEITFADDASGQNGCSGTGSLLRIWAATDSCGNESTCEQTIMVEDTTAPTISCPANTTVQCDGSTDPAITGSATGTDNCNADILISHNDDTSGQTGCNGTGDLIRTWTAADLCGNESTCEQIITVEDTTTPAITCPPNILIECNGNTAPKVTGTATASDNCSATIAIDFTDDASGLIGCNGTGDLVRHWQATDDCGNESTCQQIITLEDTTAPVISCPPNTSVECMQPNDPTVTGVPILFDNCTANPTSTFEDDASGVVNCEGDIFRTWTGMDDCGNSVTCTQVITITAPPCNTYFIEILQVNPPSSPSGDDGSINAQVNNPDHLPPFDIFLNGSFYVQVLDDPFVISNLAAGMYDVQVIDANGCPSEITTVEVPFTLVLKKIIVPLGFENQLLPSLIVSSGVEHPSILAWQPVAFLLQHSNAFVFRQIIKGNNFWQLGISQAFGTAVFENANISESLLIDVLNVSARQEFFHQFTGKSASFQIGGGLYQQYYDLEKNGRNQALGMAFDWGGTLSARGEFKMGKYLNYTIPATLFINKKGRFDFRITPVASFVLLF